MSVAAAVTTTERRDVPCSGASSGSVRTSALSIPPKPKAFVIAARTRAGRPSPRTCERRSHAGSICSSPAVGTSVCRAMTSAVIAASMAPAAASVCPICPLELETATRATCSGPSACAMADASIGSFSGVPVPWALT